MSNEDNNMHIIKAKLVDILKEADTKISKVCEDHKKDEFKFRVQTHWSKDSSVIFVEVDPVKQKKEVKN